LGWLDCEKNELGHLASTGDRGAIASFVKRFIASGVGGLRAEGTVLAVDAVLTLKFVAVD